MNDKVQPSRLEELASLADKHHLSTEQKREVTNLFFYTIDNYKSHNIPGQGLASIVGYMISSEQTAYLVCKQRIREIVDARPVVWPVTQYKDPPK